MAITSIELKHALYTVDEPIQLKCAESTLVLYQGQWRRILTSGAFAEVEHADLAHLSMRALTHPLTAWTTSPNYPSTSHTYPPGHWPILISDGDQENSGLVSLSTPTDVQPPMPRSAKTPHKPLGNF